MKLSEQNLTKNQISKMVLERFKTQKQCETQERHISDTYLFDMPFFTFKIQTGKPKIEFLDNTPKISLARFFEFYQTLYELARKVAEAEKLNTQFILKMIKRNDFLQETYEILNVKIKARQLEDTMLELIFPLFVSKDLAVSGWFVFDLSIQENRYFDLSLRFVEVQNVANFFTCDNVIAKEWTIDEINNPLIEALNLFFEKQNFGECLQVELPVFTAKQAVSLLSKAKEGRVGVFTEHLSNYVSFI